LLGKEQPLQFFRISSYCVPQKKEKRDQNDDRIFILTPYVHEEKEELKETAILNHASHLPT